VNIDIYPYMLVTKRSAVPVQDDAEKAWARKDWERERKRRQREAKKAKSGSQSGSRESLQPPSQTGSSQPSDAPSLSG